MTQSWMGAMIAVREARAGRARDRWLVSSPFPRAPCSKGAFPCDNPERARA